MNEITERQRIEEFIRRDIGHYMGLLETVSDETDRQIILKLLADEQEKQRDAGDCTYSFPPRIFQGA